MSHAEVGRIRFIQQLSAADCAAACLAMVLESFGNSTPLEEVRRVLDTGRDGATAAAMLEAAQSFGLAGRGVALELEQLHLLPVGSILHWEHRHFVVLSALHAHAVEIVDPARGRIRVSLEAFSRAFTGVALLFAPTPSFSKRSRVGGHLWRYARAQLDDVRSMGRILSLSLVLQAFALAVPVLTGTLVDRVVPEERRDLLSLLALGFAALVSFHFVAVFVRAHLLVHLRTHLEASMTKGFVQHLVHLPYLFFQQRPAGDLLTRLGSHSVLRDALATSALSTLLDGTLVSLYLVALFFFNRTMAWLVLGLAALDIGLYFLLRRPQQELSTETLAAQSELQNYETEMLAGIETLKAMGRERQAVEAWSRVFVHSLNSSQRRGRLDAFHDAAAGALRIGSELVVLLVGAHLVLAGRVSLGTMLALNALAGAFLGPLSSLVDVATHLLWADSHLDRVRDVLEAAPEHAPARDAAPPLEGNMVLEGVGFRYAKRGPLVLSDVSVTIEKGQFLAIVGRSGSGKSTLARVLAGLYAPSHGRVLYDGLDLATLDASSVRRQLGIVPQRPSLFAGTIRSNIGMGDASASLESIREAARLACLSEDIDSMPMRYETMVIDGGASFSGGQRQRMALARAVLPQPKILLLDEATSAVDASTEIAIFEHLLKLPCTKIVIAHRLSTYRHADQILVLDGGAIVERGTHDELVQKRGVYSSLVEAQL